MYITFSQYKEKGGATDEAVFPRLEFLARQKLDRYTQGRVRTMEVVPEAVEWCMAALIDAMDKADLVETAASAPLSGFSNDGYSESYAAPLTADALEAGLYGIITSYLAAVKDDKGTPLLYLGVGG